MPTRLYSFKVNKKASETPPKLLNVIVYLMIFPIELGAIPAAFDSSVSICIASA